MRDKSSRKWVRRTLEKKKKILQIVSICNFLLHFSFLILGGRWGLGPLTLTNLLKQWRWRGGGGGGGGRRRRGGVEILIVPDVIFPNLSLSLSLSLKRFCVLLCFVFFCRCFVYFSSFFIWSSAVVFSLSFSFFQRYRCAWTCVWISFVFNFFFFAFHFRFLLLVFFCLFIFLISFLCFSFPFLFILIFSPFLLFVCSFYLFISSYIFIFSSPFI